MTAPIAYMVPDSPGAVRHLRDRLREQKLKCIEELVSASDWSDFKERLGKVRGLEMALQICAEVEKEMRN